MLIFLKILGGGGNSRAPPSKWNTDFASLLPWGWLQHIVETLASCTLNIKLSIKNLRYFYIVNLLYFLFPGLTQEYLDHSFWFKHKTTPLNNQSANLLIWRFSDTRFIYYAIETQHALLHYHTHKAWQRARFNLALSLNELLANQVASVVREGNLRSGRTSQFAEPILSAESVSNLGWSTATIARCSTNITDTVKAASSWVTLMVIGLPQDKGAGHILTVYQCCLSRTKLLYFNTWSTKALLFPKVWVKYMQRDLSISVHNLVPKTVH